MSEQQTSDALCCKVCGKPLVFKGYYSNGYPDFVGENWDCEDECVEEVLTDE